MPKLPKGMRMRGKSYTIRLYGGGRERWISLGPDYKQARARLRDLRSGAVVSGGRMTVAEASKEWLASYVATARSPKGLRIAERRVERYLIPGLGGRFLSRLLPDDLRRYRLYLETQDIAVQTVAHLLSDVRSLLNWAEDSRLIGKSPFPRRLMPRIQERAPDRLTADDVERVLSIREPYRFMVWFALETGLRWGELVRADASHIENGNLVVAHTKSGKVRRVPLGPELQAEIRKRIGRLVPYSQKSSGAFQRLVQNLSGVERFHPHQLRHTFACQWLERGGSLAALQQQLGHSTVVTTQRYARLGDDMVMREAERIRTRIAG